MWNIDSSKKGKTLNKKEIFRKSTSFHNNKVLLELNVKQHLSLFCISPSLRHHSQYIQYFYIQKYKALSLNALWVVGYCDMEWLSMQNKVGLFEQTQKKYCKGLKDSRLWKFN